jgi:hypothetical protein
MRVAWLVIAAASTTARAAPVDDTHLYAVGAAVGPQLAITANDNILGRVAVSGSRRWSDRWQVGLDATLVVGTGVIITEQLVEAGVWIHPSKRLDVLLGWRVGHAWFDFSYAHVHAAAFQPVALIAVRLAPRLDLQVEPFTANLYLSGIWQITTGGQLGLAWWL